MNKPCRCHHSRVALAQALVRVELSLAREAGDSPQSVRNLLRRFAELAKADRRSRCECRLPRPSLFD